jgi:hypothetical protein
MTYIPIRSGFTGPRAKIGGSTEYHQDLKLLQSLPVAERVKMLDAIAKQNQSIGREIEFANPAVSGRRWNLNAELAEKVDLLERAATAHGHSKHPGWQSFDYYTPLKGKNRFEKGAVEDASIYLPAVASGKVRRGSGGGYGYFSESLDPSGRVIARVGHGNIDRPEAGDVNVLGASPQAPVLPGTPPTTAQQPTQTTEDLLKRMLLQEALAPSKSQDFLTSFLMQNPYLAGGQEQSA